jgi:glycosyltransferase involved in cell wall biosynthesis
VNRRVLVVGSGTRFLSGISYYTWHLSDALADRFVVSVVLMRRLLPARLYPGRARVGADLTPLRYEVPCFDGVDWFWAPSLFRALRFVRREQPEVVAFQWWTATVGHSYLVLAWVARRRGAAVVVEFHEVLDTGEARMRLVARYGRLVVRGLLAMASGVVVHSEFDRKAVAATYGLEGIPTVVAPVGPLSHHESSAPPRRDAPPDVWNLLFFGTIRPYKGLEHAVEAFDALPDEIARRCWLTIVGETWEGWHRPLELVPASPRRDRITVVNRYVDDDELAGWIAGADVAILPYLRSSASGPLHIVMHAGIPAVVTAVGGLVEAAGDYGGATFVPPADAGAITTAIEHIVRHGDRTERYADPQSWERTLGRYTELIEAMAPAG